jgi:hypothetical protein
MTHYEGDNIGSIAGFKIAHTYDLQSFNPVTFKNGRKWLDVPFKEQSGNLALKVEDTPNGPVYMYSGNFSIHNLRDQVDNEMHPFIGSNSVAMVTDLNGRVYVIGTPEIPVTLTMSGGTGQRYVDENGQEFQFKVDQIKKALGA